MDDINALEGMNGTSPDDMEGVEGIEIEIENPDDVTLRADGMEIDLMPEDDRPEYEHEQNLAELLDEDTLNEIASELMDLINSDKASRKDWVDTYVEGLEVLGLDNEERTEPWEGACGIVHPLILEAAVRFQSETITETFPAGGPVSVKIIGKETPEKLAAAKRVKEDMNYRLTEQMVEYRFEHEKLLFGLPLAGAGFKKVYDDSALGRQTSRYLPAEDVILPFGVASARDSHRVTHVMRLTKNELRKLQVRGFYRDFELTEPVMYTDEIQDAKAEKHGMDVIADDRYTLFEIHCELNLEGTDDEDEDGIEAPYVVTIDHTSGKVLAIRRNWLEEDELRLKRSYFVNYCYVPGFGPYGFGLIHLVGGLAKGATSMLRQLIDSGTLSNLPGGLKSRGLRIKGDDTPIAPGEFRDVDVPTGTVRDNIMPLPYKEPSQVLLALFNGVVEEGRRMAATADLKISDMSAQAPVGTTLALLERQLKVMSAVQARVHNSMKEEFKLLKAIIREYAAQGYEYSPDTGEPMAMQADYDAVDVIPVSDPNASTMSQRIAQLQAVTQLSQGAPNVYDMAELHRSAVEMIGLPNANKIVPLPDDKTRVPKDPVRENMAALIGEPMKAFRYQDHRAHIAVHQMMLQDPAMQQVLQSPTGQTIAPAVMAHIQEHMAFEYAQQIEMMLGVQLPEDDQPVPAELERQMSGMMMQAAQQLLQRNQQAAQAQQAQQMAQDPVIQQQERELAIKEAEVSRKARNDERDYELGMERLAVERERFEREDVRASRKDDVENLKAQADLRLKANESNMRARESAVKMTQSLVQSTQNAQNPQQTAKQPPTQAKPSKSGGD